MSTKAKLSCKIRIFFSNDLGINTENGLVQVDENYQTNIDGIYVGGDLVESKTSVCKAISTGKKAAKAILERKESET